MKQFRLLISAFFLIISLGINAQQEWNGKRCAVVLTYDDALNVHLDNAITCLDSFGLKGTFYITGESQTIARRMMEWRNAAERGHELGNHTLTHPCDGSKGGRTWVTPEKDLSRYSVQRAVNEIKVTSTLLQAIDGKTERTFAYPCGDTYIDTVNFYSQVENYFTGARGVHSGLQQIKTVDLNNINCFSINGQSAEYMINLVKQAMETQSLIVFLFHGVGGEHSLNVSLEAHRELVKFISQHKDEIWNATMLDLSKYIRERK